MATERVFGSELRAGDTIETWWAPNRDTITALKPYRGVYENDILKGAQIASFALNKTGMTIEARALFTRIYAQTHTGLEG